VAPSDATLTRWFDDHRGFLWGLCYRITGSAADADDLVQETFIRALQHGPDRLDDPRRWLTRVAVNAARDALRRRKRRAYIGTWLPTPIETSGEEAPPSYEPVANDGGTLEGRYDLLESASLAFLQALEVLTPTQRAVLLLSDVFDYSAAEVAGALDLSVGNIRTIHHRARSAMAAYDRRRSVPTASNRSRTYKALEQFLAFLDAGDVRSIERMLAADVRAVSDGGGEFTATARPILGPARVARFFARLAASRRSPMRITMPSINGFPAVQFEFEVSPGRRPPRLVLSVDVNAEGLISAVRVIASSTKLAAIPAVSEGLSRPGSSARIGSFSQ
jgi:RNA polymerase sigma factor (sigma-70 family)